MLPLDFALAFDPAREEEFYSSVPPHPGVFLIEPAASSGPVAAQPYLARTADLRCAAERLLRAPESISKRLKLREVASVFRYRQTASRFEQLLVLYQQARARFPERYRDFLRLRPPALLKLNRRNPYPRCYVTRRILADEGYYFGPFASRQAADSFVTEFLNLFKIRRCQIKIRRDPEFPGCIYSEMKMCLAPCFAGCTAEEYQQETSRVLTTLDSCGRALTGALEGEREAASAALDFERAAASHRKMEKAKEVLRGLPELARRLDQLDAVVVQRAAEAGAIAVFAVHGGVISDPFFLRFGELSSQPRSVEEILRRHLEPAEGADQGADGLELRPPAGEGGPCGAPAQLNPSGVSADPGLLEEHLSILARWFYSKPRAGEILFREGGWPYRRILRACARVLAAVGAG